MWRGAAARCGTGWGAWRTCSSTCCSASRAGAPRTSCCRPAMGMRWAAQQACGARQQPLSLRPCQNRRCVSGRVCTPHAEVGCIGGPRLGMVCCAGAPAISPGRVAELCKRMQARQMPGAPCHGTTLCKAPCTPGPSARSAVA